MNIPRAANLVDMVRPAKTAIFPNKMSKETIVVPKLIEEYSESKNPIKGKLKSLPYMMGCLYDIKKGFKIINKNPVNPKTEYSEVVINELKELAEKYEISNIGFCRVEPEFIFKDSFAQFENTIVLSMVMNRDKMRTSPSQQSLIEVFRTYYRLGNFTNKAAKLLQKHGYGVHPGHALGGDINYPLLAHKAGLGEFGKHGILITEKDGSSIRLASVFTSMELIDENTIDHSWIIDFCNQCDICVRECPANAIYKDTQLDDLGRKKHIETELCAVPFSNQYGCSVCIKECVFFKGDYTKIKNSFIKKTN